MRFGRPTNAYETFKKVLSDIDIQIQQTETSLKSLKAERRVLDPRQPILDDPDLDELRTQLEHRESQLEDVARSAREALEAQSAEVMAFPRG